MSTGQQSFERAGSQLDGKAALAVRLVEAIEDGHADARAPTFQLHDHVDIDALGQLLAHADASERSRWDLTFTVDDATVTVTSDGEVDVR